MENGTTQADDDHIVELVLDDADADRPTSAEEEEEDNVSEISGLSDISITGAGRWHPMKGLSCANAVLCNVM